MTDESMAARIARLSDQVSGRTIQARTERESHILLRLSLADYCSFVALLFAWGATVLLLSGEPNWAIVAMFWGFGFDKLDGYIARQYDRGSAFGRYIDSFVDVFVYLMSAAMLYRVAISPHPAASVIIGFLIIAFGGLRLVRFTEEGFITDSGTSYYRGITVVHTNLLVLANYFLLQFIPEWNGWLAAASIAIACPIMVSNYHSEKTVKSQSVVAAIGLAAIGLCLALEGGYV